MTPAQEAAHNLVALRENLDKSIAAHAESVVAFTHGGGSYVAMCEARESIDTQLDVLFEAVNAPCLKCGEGQEYDKNPSQIVGEWRYDALPGKPDDLHTKLLVVRESGALDVAHWTPDGWYPAHGHDTVELVFREDPTAYAIINLPGAAPKVEK